MGLLQHNLDATGGTTTSFASAPTVGNVVVYALAKAVASEPVAPTDNKGNTYTKRVTIHEIVSGNWVHIYTAPISTSGGTFTITHPGGGTVEIMEYSSVDLTTVDSNSATSGSGSPSLSLTTGAANETIVAVGYDEGTATQTAGSGFTMEDTEADNNTHERMMVEDGVFASAGAQSITWGNTVAPWAVAAIGLRPTTVPAISRGLFFFWNSFTALAPSWGAANDLWLALYVTTANGTTASAAPTNYSGFVTNSVSSGGSQVATSFAYRQLNAATETPGSFTATSDRWWMTVTLAVKPASGGGVPSNLFFSMFK